MSPCKLIFQVNRTKLKIDCNLETTRLLCYYCHIIYPSANACEDFCQSLDLALGSLTCYCIHTDVVGSAESWTRSDEWDLLQVVINFFPTLLSVSTSAPYILLRSDQYKWSPEALG